VQRKDAELQRVKAQSSEASARAERLLAEAANARGEEKIRLEAEAAKARADSDKFGASATDYQTLTQQRESELAASQKSRNDLDAVLKTAKEVISRLSTEKADLQRKLTAAEAENAELNGKLAEKGAAVRKPTVAPPPDAAPGEVSKLEPKKPIPPGTVKVNLQDGLPYVWIPPGDFSMGCSPGDRECDWRELPVRKVTITRGFWLGQTEVTQAAYRKVIKSSPSLFTGEKLPVGNVS
jgi:formylglycine-generating enzyme required for sulfatase activity